MNAFDVSKVITNPIQLSYESHSNHYFTLLIGILSYHFIMWPSPPKMRDRNVIHLERPPGAKLNAHRYLMRILYANTTDLANAFPYPEMCNLFSPFPVQPKEVGTCNDRRHRLLHERNM